MARPPGTYDALRGGQTDQPDYNSLKVEHATAPEVAPDVAATADPDYQPEDRSAFKPKPVHDTLTLGDNALSNRSQIMAYEADQQKKERAAMLDDVEARTPKSFEQSPEERAATIEAQKAATKDDLEKDER
jgi:hypothetical protein